MTKLLYIPSGEIILFIKNTVDSSGMAYTSNYEDAIWFTVYGDPIEEVIKSFCNPETEYTTKRKHNIPTNVELSYSEFEIIYD